MLIKASRTASDREVLRLAGVLVFGAVLATLDTTIVNVGLGAIAHDLGGPISATGWVSTGYLLAVAVVIPLSGWASERFGGRRMWLVSVALFTAGSALCGLAWSARSLIAFRILQGLGGGMMQPIGQALFARAAGPRLGRLIGIVTLPATFAPVLGPVLGGVLVQHLGWRWMFTINVPIGIATIVAAVRVVPADETHRPGHRLDVTGLALLSPGLAALVYGLGARNAVALGAGALALAAYGWHSSRARQPLIDLRLFARRGFAVATGNSFLLGASLYSSMLLLPLYYQQVWHASVFDAGLLLVPQALGSAVALYFAGRIAERFGPRAVLLTGVVLALAGTFPFTQQAPAWLLTVSLLVRGIGLGATTAPGMAAVYAAVERDEVHRAAAVVNVVNRAGGSLGTAILVTVLENQGFTTTFWWALGLSALSLVPAALFPRRSRCAA
ncbi:MDR family MFS transporter [Amycolatopsis rhizosphaerae]|uniref:MDR family MFS transporter n=1 Tax=Amycolatopsis rhizosphaerae TaxID=2053003 RepID=UPI001FECA614|nr:MDR family MFS transporter [Amycolatopsis rhizosphaerae]